MRLPAERAEPLEHGEPVHRGQHQIEHDHIVFIEARVIESVRPVGDEIDGVTHLAQPDTERAQEALGVLDDEQFHFAKVKLRNLNGC